MCDAVAAFSHLGSAFLSSETKFRCVFSQEASLTFQVGFRALLWAQTLVTV